MKVCFIANYQKTLFFYKISEQLKKNGIEIFWISANKQQAVELEKNSPKENILLIDKSLLDTENLPIDDFKIKELVHGDRCLKYENWGINYLKKIQSPIYNFIKQKEINLVIGEITWAHEILILRIIKSREELNAKFLNPHTIRIPSDRFAFFTDEFQSKIFEIEKETSIHTTPTEIKVSAPDYLQLNNTLLKKSRTFNHRAKKLYNFITRWKKDFNDPTLTTSHLRTLTKRIKEELNKELYRFIPRKKFDESIRNEKYVLLTLHKQPEASIDVIGRYYEDQEVNITNISRSLPDNWKLLIKEHTNAIGDRSIFFFTRLLRDPAIVLIDENESSLNIIENAQLVITVSGTVAYEAAMKGIPSATFADTFFNKLGLCKKLTLEDLRNSDIPELIEHIKESESKSHEFKNWILRNSFEGIISDPISNPKCITSHNIEKVSDAILTVGREIIPSARIQ